MRASAFDLAKATGEIETIQGRMNAPGFWEDGESARAAVARLTDLKGRTEPWADVAKRIEDASVLAHVVEDGDAAGAAELEREIAGLESDVGALELEAAMTDPHDRGDCFVDIHAGAGGTESCDWAQMLLRMYTRWAERAGYRTEIVDVLANEEAGIKSVALAVRGPYAFGRLRCEIGVHRLVRMSPFDAAKRRHTSFASVDVTPDVPEAEVEILDRDLRVDTYRAGGAGGQHVNKTDSAVRITHLPTGVVVQCQNERSQHKNRATAMRLLRAKMLQMKRAEREAELAKAYGEKGEIAWGYQIRSYVLAPYRLVKDHRTGVEIGDVEAVLGGEIDPLIDACLRARGGAAPPREETR